MVRDEFLSKRAYYQQQSDFTKKEKKEFTFQEQNFIRGIQIVRDVSKNDAIRHYRGIRKRDTEQLKRVSLEIQSFYDKPHILRGFAEPQEITPTTRIEGTKKTKYTYAGYAKKAKKRDLERFKSLGGTARKYTDTRTGEIISRRERDKRLYILVTNY